ncbi:MAG: MAPEG family protein [Pseudomonadota bacterium]
MTPLQAAALYTSLFILLFLALKMNCGRVRVAQRVNFGEGGNDAMARAMRTQANAVEDVPIILIGLFALVGLEAPVALIHGIGAVFFIGRVLHALGLGGAPGLGWGRLVGTIITLLTFLTTAGACLWLIHT